MTYAYTTIPVTNMDDTIAFYNGLLGLDILVRFPIENGGELAKVGKQGEPCIEFLYYPDRTLPAISGFTLGFEVESLADATAMMTAAGYPCVRGPIEPSAGVRFSFFIDPNDIEIQLTEHNSYHQ